MLPASALLLNSRLPRPQRPVHHEEPPQKYRHQGRHDGEDDVDPEPARDCRISISTVHVTLAVPIEEGHGEHGLVVGLIRGVTPGGAILRRNGGVLAAKKVPGRNTMVTSAMDRMCRESRRISSAMCTLVSPLAC